MTLVLASCGGSDGTGGSQSYKGPGSSYTLSFSGTTFTLSEADDGWTVIGDWVTTATGFKRLTITGIETSGSNVPSVGDTADILDIPGVMAILKPLGSNTQIINMVKSGECPSGTFTGNWIDTNKYIDITSTTRDSWGTFEFLGSGTGNLPARYAFDGTDLGTNSLGTLTCTDGVASVDGATMYLTQVGGAIVHTGTDTPADDTDDSFIFALDNTAIDDMTDLDGTYDGLVFETSTSGGDNVFPVAVTLDDGTGDGAQVTDITTGATTGTVEFTFTGINNPSNGFIAGTIGGSTARCMGNVNINKSGKNVIFCLAENPGEAGKLYNLLLVSR